MDAIEVQNGRTDLGGDAFAEIAIWRVPVPVRGSSHYFKYRLALIVDDVCVLRYDNEAGKGDHRHVDGQQLDYTFVGAGALRRDFFLDARAWLERHHRY
jgi:hypothetical protein